MKTKVMTLGHLARKHKATGPHELYVEMIRDEAGLEYLEVIVHPKGKKMKIVAVVSIEDVHLTVDPKVQERVHKTTTMRM